TEPLAHLDKIGDFTRRFRVDNPANAGTVFGPQKSAAVSNDRDGIAGEPGVRTKHFRGIVGLELGIAVLELILIENCPNYLFDVIGEAMIRRQHTVEILSRRAGLRSGRRRRGRGQIAETLPNARDTIAIVFGNVVRYS